MVSESLKLTFNLLNSSTGYWSSSVRYFSELKCEFFSKTTRRICTFFFQDLGEKTCSLQAALKSTTAGLYRLGVAIFTNDCNEQVFSSNPKKFGADSCCRVRENRFMK